MTPSLQLQTTPQTMIKSKKQIWYFKMLYKIENFELELKSEIRSTNLFFVRDLISTTNVLHHERANVQ